jgi:hypothetical protein
MAPDVEVLLPTGGSAEDAVRSGEGDVRRAGAAAARVLAQTVRHSSMTLTSVAIACYLVRICC